MNKKKVLKKLRLIRDNLPLFGTVEDDIDILLSLSEEDYIESTKMYGNKGVIIFTDILITNAGHDFIIHAEELELDGIDISNMSYEDINFYGNKSLLKSLGLY